MKKYELFFEAADVNNEGWDEVIKVLMTHMENFRVFYGDGDHMKFEFISGNYE